MENLAWNGLLGREAWSGEEIEPSMSVSEMGNTGYEKYIELGEAETILNVKRLFHSFLLNIYLLKARFDSCTEQISLSK